MSYRLEDIRRPVDAVPPETLVQAVMATFRSDLSLEAIPVVLDEEPIGLISRDTLQTFLLEAPSRDMLMGIPITKIMDSEPVCAEAQLNIGFFGHQCLSGTFDSKAFRRGVILVEDGAFAGFVAPGALSQGLARLSVQQTHFIQASKTKLATQARQADDTLRHNREQVAMLAHEIRTPLIGLTGLADLLGDMGLPSKATKLTQAISQSGQAIERLVTDMVDFAAIEAGEIKLKPETIDLGAMVKDLKLVWQAHKKAKQLDFDIKLAPKAVNRVYADPVRLRQIINNLISNALKHTRQGEVSVTLDACSSGQDDVQVSILVTDTGTGISDVDKDIVLKAWGQGKDTSSAATQGAGLGLAIVRSLAARMGGSIELKDNPGGGTQVHVRVKVKARSLRLASDRTVTTPSKPRANFELGRILVADDHGLSRYVIEQTLSEAGWTLDVVHNGAQALRRAQSHPYQAILLDIHMPEVNGDEVLSALLQSSGPNVNTPIIAMSADVSRNQQETCRAKGFASFMPKPIRPRQLVTDLIDVILAPQTGDTGPEYKRYG